MKIKLISFFLVILKKYEYLHDVLFTLVGILQLQVWHKAKDKIEELEFSLLILQRTQEKDVEGSLDSWDY